MAAFKDWALQYVLADDEAEMRDIAASAAREIENSRASSTAVGNWASSIHEWMRSSAPGAGDQVQDNGDGDNIIMRAKALGFLAATLEALDPSTLKKDQVQRLSAFFGSTFSYDHKAGITASAKALRRLVSAKAFRPEVGVKIIEDVCKIREDFRLQTAATRLEVYELLLQLIQDPKVGSELRQKDDSSYTFVSGLLQLCQHERDPKNLMVWFKVLRILLTDYSLPPETSEDVFKTFSAYFPISIRSSAAPAGITAEDLKGAVRDCFAANQSLAPHAYPFLLEKIDQGDAITVAVKEDILKTIKGCVDRYEDPENSLVPYIDKIWSCLKYEVRNGEIPEAINGTLDVIRSISTKLDGASVEQPGVTPLKNYIDLVFGDCHDDLSNPTYAYQAGVLLVAILQSNVTAFTLESQKVVESIVQNLRQPKSPSHAKDLLGLLGLVLGTRAGHLENLENIRAEHKQLLENESLDYIRGLFQLVYLPTWRECIDSEPAGDKLGVLKEAIQGMVPLCCQKVLLPSGETSLLNSEAVCSEICSLFIHRILGGLTLSSNDNSARTGEVEDEIVRSLESIVSVYREGFPALVDGAKAAVKSRDWKSPSQRSLVGLKDLMARLAFIGCSSIPSTNAVKPVSTARYSPLDHFITLTGTLLEIVESMLELKADPSAVALVLSGIHGAMRNFSDAFLSKSTQIISLLEPGKSPDWLEEFQKATDGAQVSPDWNKLMSTHYDFQAKTLDKDTNIGEGSPAEQKFFRLSVFIVRHLHRRFTKETPTSNEGVSTLDVADELAAYRQQNILPDAFLYQLTGMTSFIIRRLDTDSQKSYNLATEAFQFFRSSKPSPPYWSKESNGVLTIMTMGMLESLRPDAMVELYEPGGIAQTIMCDTDTAAIRFGGGSYVRSSIVTILANKYKAPSAADPSRLTFKNVLDFWESRIKDDLAAVAPSKNEVTTSEPFNPQALSIMAGAIARQDKDALNLLPLLKTAIELDSPDNKTTARSIEVLIREKSFLTKETHAKIGLLYRQWFYARGVKPLYELALPVNAARPQADNYTVAILSILKHCPFSVYGDDAKPLARLLITALLELRPLPDLLVTLQTLLEVLRNDPDTVKEHLKAVIDAVLKVYDLALGGAASPSKARSQAAPACRRLVLQLLAELPGKFEERHLLPYAPRMKRMLATASGDPFREVRKAALVARESWEKVS